MTGRSGSGGWSLRKGKGMGGLYLGGLKIMVAFLDCVLVTCWWWVGGASGLKWPRI